MTELLNIFNNTYGQASATRSVGWCAVLFIVIGANLFGAGSQRTRTIVQDPQVAIADRLRPGDKIVVVERPHPPPLGVEAQPMVTPEQAVGIAAAYAHAIAVLEIRSSKAILVENDSWIATITEGEVVDVIKQAAGRPLETGQDITVTDNDGELVVKGVNVRAGPPEWQSCRAKRRCVVFLAVPPEGRDFNSIGQFVIRKDGTLDALFVGKRGSDWRERLTGMRVEKFVKGVREQLDH